MDTDIYLRIVYLGRTQNPEASKTFMVYRISEDRAYWPRSYSTAPIDERYNTPFRPDFEESTTIEHLIGYLERVIENAPAEFTRLTLEYQGVVEDIPVGKDRPMPSDMSANLARLMVRRHLRTWVNSGHFSEDELVVLFLLVVEALPDTQFKRVASIVDGACRRAVDADLDTGVQQEARRYLTESIPHGKI